MSFGSRKIQRSVRVTVASTLVVLAVCGVAAAVATSTGVSVAAVAAALTGIVATRIMYTEITQTHRDHALDRAAQAKSFAEALRFKQSEHTAYVVGMSSRLSEKEQTIGELHGAIRLAEARVDDAEDRVKRESRRANDAQTRLSALLDEVLAAQAAEVAPNAAGDIMADDIMAMDELPTIVDLLAWEERQVQPADEPQHLKKEA